MAQPTDVIVTTPKGFQCNVTRTGIWLDAEFTEYMQSGINHTPSKWKEKKKKDLVTVYKRDQKSLGEPHSVACYNARGIMNTNLERIHDFMHVKFIENSPKWTKTFQHGEIIERPAKEIFGPLCDEVVINYVAHKLPVINNRDFVFYSFKRFFTAPNPMTPDRPKPTRGIAFFTTSTPTHPSYPDPLKGYVRAHLNKVVCVVQEIDGDATHISYYYIQQSDPKGLIPKAIQGPETINHIIAQFNSLHDHVRL